MKSALLPPDTTFGAASCRTAEDKRMTAQAYDFALFRIPVRFFHVMETTASLLDEMHIE
ncbi:hypothetical protein [Paracidobacterium acidisoli]|uniref:hypothetical protein n=1 Tax=Paracidobacterium acidisoli TaxID=2303751 RepID=UPI00131423A6|nr:hypothetical protein [Paracidobacterium acidisoli]MBT9329970.1 hypothetical protein [Paracidobacterium acidisoli]